MKISSYSNPIIWDDGKADRLLVNDPRCSLLIDNRENLASDFSNSISVTATGVYKELDESEKPAALQLFLKRHSYLVTFTQSPNCSFICLQPMAMLIARYVMLMNSSPYSVTPDNYPKISAMFIYRSSSWFK